jgi:hypothetical protein
MASWDKFISKYKKIYEKLEDPEQMEVLGEYVAQRIRLRTRLGLGVEKPGANPKPLAPLKDSTKKARKQKQLNSDTGAGFSNLTETGQLLDSIKVTSKGRGYALVGPEGSRNDGKNNRNIGYYQTIGDPKRNRERRPFNNMSRAEKAGLKNFIAKLVAQFLKRGS